MNISKHIIALLTIFTTVTFAQIPPGQWMCYAFDGNNKSYEGMGDSVKTAMKDASKNCFNNSNNKKSCKTAQSYCQQGPLSLIDDRCVVTDTNGRTWNATGPRACDVALSLCKRWQFLHGKTNPCSVKHF